MTIYTYQPVRGYVQGGVTDQHQTRVGRLVFGTAPWTLDGEEQETTEGVFALSDEHVWMEIQASDWPEPRAVWPAYEVIPEYVEGQPPIAEEFRSFAMMPSKMQGDGSTTDYFKNLWKRGAEWVAVFNLELAEDLTGSAVTDFDVVSIPASTPKQFAFWLNGHVIYVLDWTGNNLEIREHDFSSNNVSSGFVAPVQIPNGEPSLAVAPFELATTIPIGNFDEIPVTKPISGLPPSGWINLNMDGGSGIMWVAYSSYSGNVFTCIPSYLSAQATAGNLLTVTGRAVGTGVYMDADANPIKVPEISGGFLLSYFGFGPENPLVGKALTLEVTNSPTLGWFQISPTNPEPGVYKFNMPATTWSVYIFALDEENPPEFTLTLDEDDNDAVGHRPEAKRPYQDASLLRYLEANADPRMYASQRVPDTRKRVGYLEQTSAGFKIDLCNELNTDAWITLPLYATEEYVRAEAAQWRDNFDPTRVVHVTVGNEAFNLQIMPQARWAEQESRNRWGVEAGISQTAKRLIEALWIWNDEMGPENRHRWKGVAECQADNLSVANQMLTAPAWANGAGFGDTTPYHSEVLDVTFSAPYATGLIDVLAPANYIGGNDFQDSDFRDAAYAALDGGTQSFFDFMYAHMRKPSSVYTYGVHGILGKFLSHKALILSLDPDSTIVVRSYEGGGHVIFGSSGPTGSPPYGIVLQEARISAENTFTGVVNIPNGATGEERIVSVVVERTWTGTVTLQRSATSATGPWTDVATWTDNVYTRYDDETTGDAWYRLGFKTGDYGSGEVRVALGQRNHVLTAATGAYYASDEHAQSLVALMKGFRSELDDAPLMINNGVAVGGIYGTWSASDYEDEAAYRPFFKKLTGQLRAEEAAAA